MHLYINHSFTNLPSIPQRSSTAVFSLSNEIKHEGAPAVPPCSPVTWQKLNRPLRKSIESALGKISS